MEFVGKEIEKNVYRIIQLEDLDEKAAKEREKKPKKLLKCIWNNFKKNRNRTKLRNK